MLKREENICDSGSKDFQSLVYVNWRRRTNWAMETVVDEVVR